MPAITLISLVPNFASPEEHTNIVGSTPTSFNDIPAVLRHKEENVSVTLLPPLDGFTQDDAAKGTLYVIESVLIFMSSAGPGFQIEYPAITLHAISRSEAKPSIYCQLDEHIGEVLEADGDITDIRELIIAPQNASACNFPPFFRPDCRC
jgi:nucleotide-sensitive chloride channel 1A